MEPCGLMLRSQLFSSNFFIMSQINKNSNSDGYFYKIYFSVVLSNLKTCKRCL